MLFGPLAGVDWPTLPFQSIESHTNIDCVVVADASQSVSFHGCDRPPCCSLILLVFGTGQIVPSRSSTVNKTCVYYFCFSFSTAQRCTDGLIILWDLSLAVQSFVNFRIGRYLVSSPSDVSVCERDRFSFLYAKPSACECGHNSRIT